MVALSYATGIDSTECILGVFASQLIRFDTDLNDFLHWDNNPAKLKGRTESSVVVTNNNHLIMTNASIDDDELHISIAKCSLNEITIKNKKTTVTNKKINGEKFSFNYFIILILILILISILILILILILF